jgi:putative heme-binding domain-containing protein
LLALARHAEPSIGPQVLEALDRIDVAALGQEDQLALIRAYALAFIRLGEPNKVNRRQAISKFARLYPSANQRLNAELCQLLIYLEATGAIETTLDLVEKATTQEERINYLFSLRTLKGDWTSSQRKRYFEAFQLTAGTHGGASFGGFLKNIRDEAKKQLTDAQRQELGDALAALENKGETPLESSRPLVKEWTLDELVEVAEKDGLEGRDFENGKQMFAAGACFKCHRLQGQGGISGPDLTAVAGRFSTRNLLESIVEPSRVISDQYQMTRFLLKDGREVIGRIVNMGNNNLSVNTNMLDPNQSIGVNRLQIEETFPAEVSPMPTGLLNTLSMDEILDLLAYLKSGGDPNAVYFTAAR